MRVVPDASRPPAPCRARCCAAWTCRDGRPSRAPSPVPACHPAGAYREGATTRHAGSCLSGTEYEVDAEGQLLPLRAFCRELFATSASEGVVARAAVVFTRTPFGRDPSTRHEAIQRRVERALVDAEVALRAPFDAFS